MIRRFNRYELKYIVPLSVRDALLPTIEAYMKPDAEGGPTGTYRVTSLYYDSPDLACYRSKIEGINYRRKVRIRRYGALEPSLGPDAPVMVEIKQRINRTTQKRRLPLPLGAAYSLCEGRELPVVSSTLDRVVAEEVMFLASSLQLRPACVIGYERRAFAGSGYEPGLRLTFDSRITTSDPSVGLSVPWEGQTLPVVDPGHVVLEVKANEVVPLWVSRLLASNGCVMVRFSKYCAGVERLRRGATSNAWNLGAKARD